MNKNKWLSCLFIGLFAYFAFTAWSSHAEQNQIQRAHKVTLNDTAQLIGKTKQWANGPLQITVKHGGPFRSYTDKEDFQRLGNELCRQLGCAPVQAGVDEEGHSIYKAETGKHAEMTLLAMDADSTYLFIRYSEDSSEETKLLHWQADMQSKLNQLGIDANWQITLHGSVEAPKQQWANDKISRSLAEVMGAEERERYADYGTFSASYYSSRISAVKRSGAQAINLQIAVHQDSETSRRTFTLGMPMLNAEF